MLGLAGAGGMPVAGPMGQGAGGPLVAVPAPPPAVGGVAGAPGQGLGVPVPPGPGIMSSSAAILASGQLASATQIPPELAGAVGVGSAGIGGTIQCGAPAWGDPDVHPDEWLYQLWLNTRNFFATAPADVATMCSSMDNHMAAQGAFWSTLGHGAGNVLTGAGNALLGIAKMNLAIMAVGYAVMNPGMLIMCLTAATAAGYAPPNLMNYLPIPHSLDDAANLATLGISGFIDPLKQWVMTGDPTQFQQYAGSFAANVAIAKGIDYAAGPGASCFVAGTPVSTEDGMRAIEAIRPDDRVWAFNHRLGTWHLKTVLEKFVREYRADMVHVSLGGETIQATMLHPFWVVSGNDLSERPTRSHLEKPPEGSLVAGRWVDATDLRAGDQLLLRVGTDTIVESVAHVPADTLVYNFSVEELKCYAVGNRQVLVHNTNGAEGAAPRLSNVPGPDFVPNPAVKGPYVRPSGAGPTAAQRAAVQGKPCVECGDVTPSQVADHIDPLVVQYYREGAVDVEAQSGLEAVQAHCPHHAAVQGGQLSAFARRMREILGF
jgi:hypothetical protein